MALTLLVISMVLIFVTVSYLEGMYWALKMGYSMRAGSIQIAASGYWDAAVGDRKVLEEDALKQLLGVLAEKKQVSSWSQELTFNGLIGTEKGSTVVNGFAVELKAAGGAGSGVSITKGRKILEQGQFEIVIGEGVASALQVKPDDWVTLISQTNSGSLNPLSFQVSGIATTGIKDADAFFALSDLDSIRLLVGVGTCERLLVFLKDGVEPKPFLDELKPVLDSLKLEGKTWMELSPTYFDLKAFYDAIFAFMMMVIVVLVCISIFELVSNTFFERFREIGTLRAIGTKRLGIFSLLIAESLCLYAVAVILTIGLGWISGIIINALHLSWRPPGATSAVPLMLSMKFENFATPLIAGFSAIIPAAFFPALRASNLSVIGVLRNE